MVSRVEELALVLLAAGVADHAVPPPASEMGRWPASWKRRSVQSCSRLPTCRLSAVGSKPA